MTFLTLSPEKLKSTPDQCFFSPWTLKVYVNVIFSTCFTRTFSRSRALFEKVHGQGRCVHGHFFGRFHGHFWVVHGQKYRNCSRALFDVHGQIFINFEIHFSMFTGTFQCSRALFILNVHDYFSQKNATKGHKKSMYFDPGSKALLLELTCVCVCMCMCVWSNNTASDVIQTQTTLWHVRVVD